MLRASQTYHDAQNSARNSVPGADTRRYVTASVGYSSSPPLMALSSTYLYTTSDFSCGFYSISRDVYISSVFILSNHESVIFSLRQRFLRRDLYINITSVLSSHNFLFRKSARFRSNYNSAGRRSMRQTRGVLASYFACARVRGAGRTFPKPERHASMPFRHIDYGTRIVAPVSCLDSSALWASAASARAKRLAGAALIAPLPIRLKSSAHMDSRSARVTA